MKKFILDREMGFTRQDFFNRLSRALDKYDYSIQDNVVTILLQTGKILIYVGTEGERRLSDFVYFPVLPVSIHFEGVDEDTHKNFIHKFNITYQKGLG